MKFFFFEKNEKKENGRRRINIAYKKILDETKLEEERNKILREKTRKNSFWKKKLKF
jgi:hypothetical protein